MVRGLSQRLQPLRDAATSSQLEAVTNFVDSQNYLDARDRATLRFVAKLTLQPAQLQVQDHQPLRAAGFEDRAIHDLVQVACCFAYMNRLADGLGVTLLPHQYDFATELFGEAALATHLAWGEAADA